MPERRAALRQRRDCCAAPVLGASLGTALVASCLRTRGGKRLRGCALRRRRTLRRAWRVDGCEVPLDGESPYGVLDAAEAEPDAAEGGPSADEPGTRPRVALLLNRNAKGVTAKVVRALVRLVGLRDCFICCSLEDAEEAVREVLDRGDYAVLACGGGDGTLASVLNLLREEVAARSRAGAPPKVIPALAVLRLGTGNALAYVLGSGRDAAADLRRIRAGVSGDGGTPTPVVAPAKLVCLRTGDDVPHEAASAAADCGGKETVCFFAGLGYDARMLRDYYWLRDKTADSKLLRPWVQSPLGYVLALLLRTLPATMRGEHLFRLRVVSLADEAYYMDPRRGDWGLLRPKGSVLFEGVAGILSAGAVPFYGGGFRLFPFAGVPGFIHVRISNIHPAIATLNIVPLWRGQFRNAKHVKDFLVREALVEVDKAVPLQHSGELVGDVTRLHLKVSDDGQVHMVDSFNTEYTDRGHSHDEP